MGHPWQEVQQKQTHRDRTVMACWTERYYQGVRRGSWARGRGRRGRAPGPCWTIPTVGGTNNFGSEVINRDSMYPSGGMMGFRVPKNFVENAIFT